MARTSDGLITVIGRGNSGTRVLSQALYASEVFMGNALNASGDTMPPDAMYEASRLLGRHVRWKGGFSWDFDQLHMMEIEAKFIEFVQAYLHDVLTSPKPHRGWKLPETTLAYPWIVRMLPSARFVHIVRDPRDCLLRFHMTDRLDLFNIPGPETNNRLDRRVVSWKYQHEIVKATPSPEHFISIRFEDLVLEHDTTMERLEDFLEIPLARVVVDKSRVGRWMSDERLLAHVEPLACDMRELGYLGS